MTDHIKLCQKSLRSLQILREQNDFFDVTLMTDDDHKAFAHKAVLSAFSPFFRSIFESCNVKEHLFLYLDVQKENLSGILDYIYKGETGVPVSQIEQFIKDASKLKISELIQVKVEDQENVHGKTLVTRNPSSTRRKEVGEIHLSDDKAEKDSSIQIMEENIQQTYNELPQSKNRDNTIHIRKISSEEDKLYDEELIEEQGEDPIQEIIEEDKARDQGNKMDKYSKNQIVLNSKTNPKNEQLEPLDETVLRSKPPKTFLKRGNTHISFVSICFNDDV